LVARCVGIARCEARAKPTKCCDDSFCFSVRLSQVNHIGIRNPALLIPDFDVLNGRGLLRLHSLRVTPGLGKGAPHARTTRHTLRLAAARSGCRDQDDDQKKAVCRHLCSLEAATDACQALRVVQPAAVPTASPVEACQLLRREFALASKHAVWSSIEFTRACVNVWSPSNRGARPWQDG
jgi:hypothetical protein